MAKRTKPHRAVAFVNQSGRCFYCGFAMWLDEPSPFATSHKLTIRQALLFQCTAEHLIAVQDGGKTTRQNIVAACWLCNQRRHRTQVALEPDAFRIAVRRHIKKGRWLPDSCPRP